MESLLFSPDQPPPAGSKEMQVMLRGSNQAGLDGSLLPSPVNSDNSVESARSPGSAIGSEQGRRGPAVAASRGSWKMW